MASPSAPTPTGSGSGPAARRDSARAQVPHVDLTDGQCQAVLALTCSAPTLVYNGLGEPSVTEAFDMAGIDRASTSHWAGLLQQAPALALGVPGAGGRPVALRLHKVLLPLPAPRGEAVGALNAGGLGLGGVTPAAAQSSTTWSRSTSSRMPFWLAARTAGEADSIPRRTRSHPAWPMLRRSSASR